MAKTTKAAATLGAENQELREMLKGALSDLNFASSRFYRLAQLLKRIDPSDEDCTFELVPIAEDLANEYSNHICGARDELEEWLKAKAA